LALKRTTRIHVIGTIKPYETNANPKRPLANHSAHAWICFACGQLWIWKQEASLRGYVKNSFICHTTAGVQASNIAALRDIVGKDSAQAYCNLWQWHLQIQTETGSRSSLFCGNWHILDSIVPDSETFIALVYSHRKPKLTHGMPQKLFHR
jgi:hypothetical protein